MANGFTSRWNGKVLAKLLGLGSAGMTLYSKSGNPNISPSDFLAIQGLGNVPGAPSTATLTIPGYGVKGPLSSIGGLTYALGAPVVGRDVTIYSNAIGDGARKISSTAAGATIGSTLAGAAFLNFSTSASQSITMKGVSTAAWVVTNNVGSVSVSTS